MDEKSLIDFNNEICYKVPSPLIPAPKFAKSRLSDAENTPFDKVLRTIQNKDDPFECNTNTSFNNNITCSITDTENKENFEHLISPIQTPIKSKKFKKLNTSPLYVSKLTGKDKQISPNQLPVITETHNLSLECTTPDTSLQILSDSVLNRGDDLWTSLNFIYNIPLPDSPDDEVSNKDVTDNSCCSTSNRLNKAFIDQLTVDNFKIRLSERSSVDSKESFNPNSFNVVSLGLSDISSVRPSVSSTISKENESDTKFNQGFLNDSSQVKKFEPVKWSSACRNNFLSIAALKSTKLNNSFAGFDYPDRRFNNCDDDSVFLEATQLAEVFRNSAAIIDLYEEDISHCTPPWEEEDVVFVDDDDEKIKETVKTPELIQTDSDDKIPEVETEIINAAQHESNCNNTETTENSNNDLVLNKTEERKDTASSNKESQENNDTQNAKDLIHNLTAILNNSGSAADQKRFGENLLNSLALALNIENPANRSFTEDDQPAKRLQRSKSDSRVNERRNSLLTKPENKITVPKLKLQPVAPVKLEKNLKVKNEKEKVTTKGPLKALIPLTNMAKTRKSIAPKVTLTHTTPPKQALQNSFHIKKTSTPNDPKIKPPIAQSTPDVTKMQATDVNSVTPKTKRHFGFQISPLSRPASTGDISNVSLNMSLSPKNKSGSAPNLNKSGSNLSRIPSNSSIPGMKSLNRRNSASDMSTSRSSTLNRSYENKQPVRPPVLLKRSSSFQNKSTTGIQKINPTDNNNTVKKYGMPGTLKSLKLVPKLKKSTDK